MARPHVYTTQAVVLRRSDFGEDSRLVTLLTPDRGKLNAVARGARRSTSKLGCHLEPFTHCTLFLAQGRSLDLVTQAATIESYRAVREHLLATTAACYAVELVDRATEHELEQRAVFDLLNAFLSRLDRGGEPEALLRFFDMRILTLLGYRPALDRCAACGTGVDPLSVRFSPLQGGLHCSACAASIEDARRVSPEAVALLRLWQSGAYRTWEQHTPTGPPVAEAASLVRACVQHAVEREPRSSRMLDRLRVAETDVAYHVTRISPTT